MIMVANRLLSYSVYWVNRHCHMAMSKQECRVPMFVTAGAIGDLVAQPVYLGIRDPESDPNRT